MKVAVTRAREGANELSARLRSEGFEAVEVPLVRIETIPGPPIRADGYDWVIVTSRIAADELFQRLEGPLPRVAVIGPGTAEALRRLGVEPDLVPAVSTQESLVGALRETGAGTRFLFVAAEGARQVVPTELGADVVTLYRTVEEQRDDFPDADVVTLASPSAARALARLRRDLPCVTIGPSTTEQARSCSLTVLAEARTHDLDGLVEAVKLARSAIASSRS